MHRPHPHSLPNCTSYHVYKLYGNLYLLNYRLYWYFLARKKKKTCGVFPSEPQLATIVPGLAGAKVSVGRVGEEEKPGITPGDQHS